MEAQSMNVDDYPLSVFDGQYTPNAASAFAELASRQGTSGLWSSSDRFAASELDGLCTFRTPEAALKYGVESEFGESRAERFVVVGGSENGECAERSESALLECVTVVDGPISRDSFEANYCRTAI